jgi:cytochrome c oxidase cbb3-type subunit 3
MVFAQNCASCHGENAAGGAVGPTLVSGEVVAQDNAFYQDVIQNGRAGTSMPAWEGRLSDQEIADVIAYIRSLQ